MGLTAANSGANNDKQKAPCASYGSSNASTNNGVASSAQVEESNATMVEKNLEIEGLEKERDFYFGKLRDIEVLAQELESADIAGPEFSQKILGVLYATEVITLFLFFIPCVWYNQIFSSPSSK